MEIVPNFQCPNCGKMSVAEGYFEGDGREKQRGNFGPPFFRHKCLACGHLFALQQ